MQKARDALNREGITPAVAGGLLATVGVVASSYAMKDQIGIFGPLCTWIGVGTGLFTETTSLASADVKRIFKHAAVGLVAGTALSAYLGDGSLFKTPAKLESKTGASTAQADTTTQNDVAVLCDISSKDRSVTLKGTNGKLVTLTYQ